MINLISNALAVAKEWLVSYGNPDAQRRRRFKSYAKKMDKLFGKYKDALDKKDAKALRVAIDNLLDRRLQP